MQEWQKRAIFLNKNREVSFFIKRSLHATQGKLTSIDGDEVVVRDGCVVDAHRETPPFAVSVRDTWKVRDFCARNVAEGGEDGKASVVFFFPYLFCSVVVWRRGERRRVIDTERNTYMREATMASTRGTAAATPPGSACAGKASSCTASIASSLSSLSIFGGPTASGTRSAKM